MPITWRDPNVQTPTAGHNSGLTWLEPTSQQERCRMLDRLDAALSGADFMAGALGQATRDYAAQIADIRKAARDERRRLLQELEAVA